MKTQVLNALLPIKIGVLVFAFLQVGQAQAQYSNIHGHFIANYKTHWNNTYVKVVVPVRAENDNYDVEIRRKKIWNQKREEIKDSPHGFIKNANYFIYFTYFPDTPRPEEVEIEFDWVLFGNK